MFGAFVGICLGGLTYAAISPFQHAGLVTPIGASAVLLFAVPSSPLAQPCPIAGGNCISVIVWLAIAQLPVSLPVEAGLTAAAAIAAMSVGRCLHPPGGAVALGATLAASAMAEDHYATIIVPVALNSLLLVAGGAFHRF